MTLPLLVLGTTNRKKGEELAALLAPWGVEVATLDRFGTPLEVDEDGDTFAANAAKKAVAQARHLHQWVLAEDSGLAVDALKGAPGVYSARFSGPGATDEANNRRLIAELAGVPIEKRTAYYVCHVALANPQGVVRQTAEARCHGRVRLEPAGTGGFGYDPLFEIVEYHRTFGELGPTVKSCLSHRSRAMRMILPRLILELSSPGERQA